MPRRRGWPDYEGCVAAVIGTLTMSMVNQLNQHVFYDEVAPIALMASDVDELRRFVADVLCELGVDDERNGWLRETFREFLARNRSYVATAEAMILHRNTIQYRVAQAMELCGQNFDNPDAVFKVQIALEICWWMAPGVLRAANR